MSEFWNTLSLVQKVFYFIAVPSTAILIFQTILTVIGFGNNELDDSTSFDSGDFSDTEFDIDGPDGDPVTESGFRLFTIKGLVAFFAIFGWTGIVILANGGTTLTASLVAFVAGLAAMAAVGAILYSFSKLEADGTLNVRNAVGHTATVYIPILPNRKPGGKVQLILQEQLRELPAVTDSAEIIPYGTSVTVVSVDKNDVLVVSPIKVNV